MNRQSLFASSLLLVDTTLATVLGKNRRVSNDTLLMENRNGLDTSCWKSPESDRLTDLINIGQGAGSREPK